MCSLATLAICNLIGSEWLSTDVNSQFNRHSEPKVYVGIFSLKDIQKMSLQGLDQTQVLWLLGPPKAKYGHEGDVDLWLYLYQRGRIYVEFRERKVIFAKYHVKSTGVSGSDDD